jgi:hypothetical protein
MTISDITFRHVLAPGLDLIAEIGERPDNRPVRLITSGRRHRPVGAYFSVKSGRMLPWESRNELHALYHAEVDGRVVESRTQPHTIRITAGGLKLLYTPDRMDRRADGSIEIVEVKNKIDLEKDAYYLQKLEMAAAIYRCLGWSIRIIEKEEIEAKPMFGAVNTIQSYRCADVSASDILSLRSRFGQRHALTLEDTKSFFPSGPVALASVCALIVRRVLAVDLSNGLSNATPVRLVLSQGA